MARNAIERIFGRKVFLDQYGRLCFACCLCDAIRPDMFRHLREDHAGNAAAKRLLELAEEAVNREMGNS